MLELEFDGLTTRDWRLRTGAIVAHRVAELERWPGPVSTVRASIRTRHVGRAERGRHARKSALQTPVHGPLGALAAARGWFYSNGSS